MQQIIFYRANPCVYPLVTMAKVRQFASNGEKHNSPRRENGTTDGFCKNVIDWVGVRNIALQ